MAKLSTILDILRFATSSFQKAGLTYGHGTENAFEEALFLVFGYLDLPFDKLDFFKGAKLQPEELEMLLNLVQARISTRKPLAYLLSKCYLQGFEFYIDERAIIPRSFLAQLITDGSLESFLPPTPLAGLDLCTGNGSLAVLMGLHFQLESLTAVDLDKNALEVARINLHKYSIPAEVLQGDTFTPLRGRKFDLIVTNPPYVTHKAMNSLPQEYLHEPQLALDGGYDGLLLVDRILAEADNFLQENGVLAVEVGDAKETLEKKYPKLDFFWFEGTEGTVFMLRKEQLAAKDGNSECK